MAEGRMVWHVWGAPTPGVAPLVLLHGGSGSWTHWLRSIAPLQHTGRQLLLPDLPGFGDSDVPPGGGQDADAMLAPLHSGLQALVGSAPVDLVGFSFGGLLAGLYAAAQPQQVQRLVVVGAPGMGVVSSVRIPLRGWRHRADALAQQQVHRHNLAALMLHDAAGIDAQTLAVHIHNVERDRLPRRRLAAGDRLAQALAAFAGPVHAIYGAHDALYPGDGLQRLEAAFAQSAPQFLGLARIAGAGHWVQHEQPAAFLAALQQALA
ncbi:alpha/beta fold hydrolase [Acidovorax sp. HDW3]|uniref:alpha/beta fold hydrolase n=1 Tax=Acidovorax sp. HDW3 TaxID=2714923 RepID=UPI00351ABACB